MRTYEGTGDVFGKARSGRPARGLANPPVREDLKACSRGGKTCTAIVSDLKACMGLSVGMKAARKFVKANTARRLRPKKNPNLTATAKRKRVRFCKPGSFLQCRQEMGKRGCRTLRFSDYAPKAWVTSGGF
jgi:hypothetical protein